MASAPEQAPVLSSQTSQEALQPLINCCIAFLVLDTLFVAGRLVSRLILGRLPFWWDDFWVMPAYAVHIGACALGLFMSNVEIGFTNKDEVILDLQVLPPVLKSIYALEQLTIAGYALTRLSIVALYLRIFSDRGIRNACWVVSALLTVQWIGFSFAGFFKCSPVDFYWDRTLEGHCFDIDNFYRAITIPNIVFDVVIIILPIPTVWQLKASRLRKWGLTLVFCFGLVGLIASSIRLYIYETHSASIVAPSVTNVLVTWLIVEPGIYVIATCLPAMHHLFAASVPQSFQEAMEQKLAAVRHPISGRGPSPNDNRAGSHPLYGQFTKLSEGETTSAATSSRNKNHSSKTDNIELESGRLPPDAIMVTTEVIITQEERIENVMGF